MRILGLFEAMAGVFATAKKAPVKWGMVAVEKDKLRKPGKASAAKKKQRKVVEASRHGNRS